MPLPSMLPHFNTRAVRSRGHWTSVILCFALVGSNGRLLSGVGPAHVAVKSELLTKQLIVLAHGKTAVLTRRASPVPVTRSVESPEEVTRLKSCTDDEETEISPSKRRASILGAWSSLRAEGFDHFLEHAMGLGFLKRSIAVKASQMSTQQQRLWRDGDVTHIDVTDRRGTQSFQMVTDGAPHRSTGFLKMPITQRSWWAADCSLHVEEVYDQHLGGKAHGQRCDGDECPLVRTRRSVAVESGELLIEVERVVEGERVGCAPSTIR